jgi:hypothetical protein
VEQIAATTMEDAMTNATIKLGMIAEQSGALSFMGIADATLLSKRRQGS